MQKGNFEKKRQGVSPHSTYIVTSKTVPMFANFESSMIFRYNSIFKLQHILYILEDKIIFFYIKLKKM